MKDGEATLRYLLAPIQPYLDDRTITEVVVNKPYEVGIERRGKWRWVHEPAFDARRLDALGILAGTRLAKAFDPHHPICMTTLPDGQRCTLVRPPAADAISITIRIPSLDKHTVRDDGFETQFDEAPSSGPDKELLGLYRAGRNAEFLSRAVKKRRTIGAIGSTGSGKTRLLKTIMQEIPADERIITVEDTAEFGELTRNRVSMFFGSAGVTAEDCMEATLRMRPDRISLQEIRGKESWAFLRVLAAGHEGGFTSWHANADDPWTPLVLMAKQSDGGRAMETKEIEMIFRKFIDIVVFCKRDESNVFSSKVVYFRDAESAS